MTASSISSFTSSMTRCLLLMLLGGVMVTRAWAEGLENWSPYLTTPQTVSSATQMGLVFGDQAFQVTGALATQRVAQRTQVAPQFNSQWSLNTQLRLQTTLTGADWNTSAKPGSHSLETKLLLRPTTRLISEAEGAQWRNLNGSQGQRLRISINNKPLLHFLPQSFNLSSSATIERRSQLNAQPATSTGFDTTATHQLSPGSPVEQLRLRYVSQPSANDAVQKSLSLSRSWQQSGWLRMRAEYERNEAQVADNILRLNWLGSF